MENKVFFGLFILCAVFHQGIANPVDVTKHRIANPVDVSIHPCHRRNGIVDLKAGEVYYYFDKNTSMCYPFLNLKDQKDSHNAYKSLFDCQANCNVSRPYSWETLKDILQKMNSMSNIHH